MHRSYLDLGFRIWGLRFRIRGLGFGVSDLGFRIWSLGFLVEGLGFRRLCLMPFPKNNPSSPRLFS